MATGSRERTPAAVEADLDAGRVSPVYLLLGDDEVGKASLIERLAGLVDADLQSFNVQRFHATDPAAVERAIDSALTLPMLGDRRVVFLMRAEELFKRKKKGTEGEDDDGPAARGDADESESEGRSLAALTEYLEAPASHACLVVVATDVNRGTRLGRALTERATVVGYQALRAAQEMRDGAVEAVRGEAERQVRQLLKAGGKAIDSNAIGPLVEYAGAEMGKLRGAVDRILLYCGDRPRVTEEDVRSVVSGEASIDHFALTRAIGRGETAEALRQLRLALDEGTSPYLLLGQIGWFVRARLAPMAGARAAEAVRLQFACDLAMKTSGGDPQVLLERLVVELCGRGAGTRRLGRGR